MWQTDWMSDVDGRLYLSELSIPGTHDTFTYNATPVAQDQDSDFDVSAQLAAGIRWFDLRLKGRDGAGGKPELFGIHGTDIPDTEFKSAVITPTIEFLDAHPGECVVYQVTNWGDAPGGTKWDEILFQYLSANGGLYVDAHTAGNRFYTARGAVPTLDMVRGKVVIFNNSFSTTAKVPGIDGTGFADDQCSTTQNASFLATPGAPDFGVASHAAASQVTFHYQGIYDDHYGSGDRAAQAHAITETIAAASRNNDPRNWYTTSTGRAGGFPSSRAFALGSLLEAWPVSVGYNKISFDAVSAVPFTKDDHQRTVGTVCGDFPNDTPGYIEAICQRNPRLGYAAPTSWDFAVAADKVLALDYRGTGRADHLVCYRPGAGTFWIMKSLADGTFRAVWQSSGIGGQGMYDLADARDLIVPLQTGQPMFFLLAYRPGTGTAWVVGGQASDTGGQSSDTAFWVNQQHTNGLGECNLGSDADRIISLFSPGDDALGSAATILCYRPGAKSATVLRHAQQTGWNDPDWHTAFRSEQGIDTHFDFSDPRDTAFAMDYSGSGHLDHLVCYRPGAGRFAVYKWTGSAFQPVVLSTTGVPGAFALTDPSDRIVATDYSGSGHQDALICYRSAAQPYLQIVQAQAGAAGFVARGGGRPWLDCLDAYPLAQGGDRMVTFSFQAGPAQNHALIYRPGAAIAAVFGNRATAPGSDYGLSYWSAPGGLGDGAHKFDAASTLDVLTPYDYRGTGRPDQIICRRSSSDAALGQFWILENAGGGLFHPLLHGATGIPCRGGGNYDLRGGAQDRVTPFDAAGTGKTTDLVAWRVGGICWVLQNNHDGTYTPVFQSTTGIADFDLKSEAGDHLTAYDWDLTGKQNHLMAYRSGTSEIGFLKLQGHTFTDVARSHTGLPGIPTVNRVIPFDYTGSGHPQHLLCWGPDQFAILQNDGPNAKPARFSVLTHQSSIAGYDPTGSDQITPFDYAGTGHPSDLLIYRPGTGAALVLENNHDGKGGFHSVYSQPASGNGIGGWDLGSTNDVLFGYDFKRTGSPGQLTAYRPGAGQIWMLEPQSLGTGFHAVYCTGGGLGF